MKTLKALCVFLLTLLLISSCTKSEKLKILSKDELLMKISESKEFIEFTKLSKNQSNIILSPTFLNSNENELILSDAQVERLQQEKKKCFDNLRLKFGDEALKTLTKTDFQKIVPDVCKQMIEKEYSVNAILNVRALDAASCKKQYDAEVNECFEDFIIDEAACFSQGLWAIVTGCHIDTIKDHIKCNRSADRHIKACK